MAAESVVAMTGATAVAKEKEDGNGSRDPSYQRFNLVVRGANTKKKKKKKGKKKRTLTTIINNHIVWQLSLQNCMQKNT